MSDWKPGISSTTLPLMLPFFVYGIATCALSLGTAFLFERLHASIPIVGSFVALTLSHNYGFAFSLSLPSPWQELLVAVALCIVCVVALRSPLTRILSLAFGLIVGGAVANILNRIMVGAVTDYISIGTFPIFNVADAAISIGAMLLLIETWSSDRKHHREH